MRCQPLYLIIPLDAILQTLALKKLDAYLATISDFNQHYSSTQILLQIFLCQVRLFCLFNLRLDWSVVDTELLMRDLSGRPVTLCPKSSAPPQPTNFFMSVLHLITADVLHECCLKEWHFSSVPEKSSCRGPT